MFRDDQPLTDILNQLPLRSLRTNSVIGWTPQVWVRVEGFYSRSQQSSLRFGGQDEPDGTSTRVGQRGEDRVPSVDPVAPVAPAGGARRLVGAARSRPVFLVRTDAGRSRCRSDRIRVLSEPAAASLASAHKLS